MDTSLLCGTSFEARYRSRLRMTTVFVMAGFIPAIHVYC
jgi:hypothetical protein